MRKVIILRDLFFSSSASLGTCLIYNQQGKQIFKKESLERGWVDNQNRISCVPEGVYSLEFEYSDRFKKELWELKGVPGRSECKFHAANYWHQLNGCIALGNNRKHIDGDLIMDVTSSRNTMTEFHNAMGTDTEAVVHIFDVPKLII